MSEQGRIVFPDLRRFFAPERVALIGATEDLGKFGGRCFKQMLDFGFGGAVYPVNPNRKEVFGRTCYPSLSALPAMPDHVGIVLPAKACVATIAECGRLGIPFVTVFSSGFGELGTDDSIALQAELVRTARAGGVRMMGPNCNGMINFVDGFALTSTATISGPRRPAGDIGIVGQSGGATQVNVMWRAQELGLGVSYQVSSGNDADLDLLDYMSFMVEDTATRVVLALAETIADGARLRALAARAADLRKPIALIKFGRTEAGARAAASHTGAVTGADAVFDAAARQLGLIRVNDASELYEAAMMLRQRTRPEGNRAAALAISGGNLVLFTDLSAAHGLSFPAFASETTTKLRTLIPGFMAVNNPADLSAGAIGVKDLFATAARTILDDPSIDVVVPLLTIAAAADIRGVATMAEAAEKPVAILWTGRSGDDPSITPRTLISEGRAVYRDALPCVQAISRSVRWSEFLRRRDGQAAPRRPVGADPEKARALLGRRSGSLSEGVSRQLLACYGLRGPADALAATPEEAQVTAARFGGMVVLKVQSPDLPHKTEAGAIRLGVSPQAVASAARQILASALAYAPEARIEGILVQEMVTGGHEMLLGMSHDATFGPVLTLGFGGIHVEVLRDVTFRLPPIGEDEARAMLEELRLAPLLQGVRGAPAADVLALTDAIVRFSWLVADLGDRLEEVDVNPLAVLPEGGGVRVLDALVVARGRPGMSVLAEMLPDGVLRLTLDRPQAANALNREMQEELVNALAEGGRNPQVRAVLLAGAGGRVFSAGADLREVLSPAAEEARTMRRALLVGSLLAVLDCPRPLIAVVRGKAIGGGAMLALLADEVLLEERASFAMPEIALGMASPLGISIVTARAGRATAHALVQANEAIDAATATQAGLADAVFPDVALDAASHLRAARLGHFEPSAYAGNKAWMNAPLRHALLEAAQEAARLTTGGHQNAR